MADRKIIVEDIHHSQTGEAIKELFPEQENHIRSICTVTLSNRERHAIVTFSQRKYASQVLYSYNSESTTSNCKVVPYYKIQPDGSDIENRSVVLTGLDHSLTEDDIIAYCERSNLFPETTAIYHERQTAQIIFSTNHIASDFGLKEKIIIQNFRLRVHRGIIKKDKKIIVEEINRKKTAEQIKNFFPGFKRHIRSICTVTRIVTNTNHKRHAVIQFSTSEDAGQILNHPDQFKSCKGKISHYKKLQHEDGDVETRSVVLTGLDPSLTEDDLITHCRKSHFCPETTTIYHEKEAAQIIFPYAAMASEFSDRRNITFPTCKLEIHLGAIGQVAGTKKLPPRDDDDDYRRIISKINKKDKNIINKQIDNLSGIQSQLLVKTELMSHLHDKYKEFNFFFESGVLHLEGYSGTISEAKTTVNTFVADINSMQYPLSSILKTLVGSEEVQKYLTSHIDKYTKETVILEFDQNHIVIHGHDMDNLNTMVEKLKELLVEDNQQYNSDDTEVLFSENWRKEKRYFRSDFGDFFQTNTDEESGVFTVAATVDVIDKLRKHVRDFLDDNRKSERFINMKKGVMQCLEKHFKAEVMQGINGIGMDIKLYPCLDRQNPGYNLVGTQENVRKVCELLDRVSNSIILHKRVIQKMAINKILTEGIGKTTLAGIEATYKVSIEIRSDDQKADIADVDVNTCYNMMVRNTSIAVIQGDILNIETDALVNPANMHLRNGGGLARSGGPKIEIECSKYVEKNGQLQEGDIFVSSPGTLRAVKIIHAVGPRWCRGGQHAKKAILENTIKNVLQEVSSRALVSVAMPYISAGNLNVQKTAEVMVRTIVNFLKATNTLNIIYLVDQSPQIVAAFKECLENQNSRYSEENDVVSQSSSKHDIPDGDMTVRCGRLHINIKNADINKEPSHAIVNILRAGFQEGDGEVERSIWKNMGTNVLKDCEKQRGQSWNILVTNPGNLLCGNIIHYAHGGSPDYVDVACRCLLKAEEMVLTSVALPAFEIGVHGTDPEVVAQKMWNGISKFNAVRKTFHIQVVTIAICATTNAAAFHTFKKVMNTKVSVDDMPTSPSKMRNKFEIACGPIKVAIKEGNITTEKTDTIFCYTSGQASRSIISRGGQTIADERTNNRGQPYIVTGGGTLPCKKVVHCSTTDSLEKDVSGALLETEKLKLQHMTFPALRTGDGGIQGAGPPNEMLNGFKRFVSERTSQYVTHINIIILSGRHDIFRLFREVIVGEYDVDEDIDLSDIDDTSQDAVMEDDLMDTVRNTFVSKKDKITLWIYSNSQDDVKNAMADVEEIWKSKISTLYIEDKGTIKGLDSQMITTINKLQYEHCVDVEIKSKIKIEGLSKDAEKVKDNIINLIRQAEETKRVLHCFDRVRWEFQKRHQTSVEVSKEINYVLETAYEDKDDNVAWKDGNVTHSMKLNREEGTGTGATGSIKRIIIQKMPIDWEPMLKGENLKTCVILNGTEYKHVTHMFKKTLNLPIRKIQRVQNRSLWLRYVVHKDEFENRHISQTLERELWHGTSADTVSKIINKCFDRNFSGKNATFYGQGAYFARDASYSHEYTRPDNNGIRYMFLCSVLTGDYTSGHKNYKDSPSKNDPSNPALRYDSVVDNVNTPGIFVVFEDAKAYPKYLIEY